MSDELFNELVESVRHGGAILRGKVGPSRAFEVAKDNQASSCISSTSFPHAFVVSCNLVP
jgi:hypothetical protein